MMAKMTSLKDKWRHFWYALEKKESHWLALHLVRGSFNNPLDVMSYSIVYIEFYNNIYYTYVYCLQFNIEFILLPT